MNNAHLNNTHKSIGVCQLKKAKKSNGNKKSPGISGRGGRREGAGRPAVGENPARLQVQITEELMRILKKKANESGVRLTDYVRSILDRYTTGIDKN